jgi:IS30 family transposase
LWTSGHFYSLLIGLDTTPTDSQLAAYVRRLNLRPRKCLNYRTPDEVFWCRPVALVI